jgi:hypothetical protein
LPVEEFTANGELSLNCLSHPRGQAQVITELAKLGKHLAIALQEVFGILQVVVKPESPGEINPPNLSVLGYEHVA